MGRNIKLPNILKYDEEWLIHVINAENQIKKNEINLIDWLRNIPMLLFFAMRAYFNSS